MTKDEALKIRKEQDEYWSKIIKQAEKALEQPMINGLTEQETNETMSVKGLSEKPAQEYLTRAQQVIRANNSAQEPVAKGFIRSLVSIDKNGIETWKEEPFYTSPPSWQGLSDDEMMEIWCSDEVESTLDFGRAIEQALKEKNS